MENSSEKNILQFEDLIFDHIIEYREQYGNYSRSVTVTNRWIDCVSGLFTSGQTTLLLTDHSATKRYFLQILTGRINQEHKTYGLVTYNGKERSWDSWKKTIKIVDFDKISLNLDIRECFKNEIKYKYPEINEEDIEIKLDDLLKNAENLASVKLKSAKLKLEDLQIQTVILHTLLEPEILILDNVKTENLHNSVLMNILNDFAKNKNAIVIVVEKKLYFNFNDDEYLDSFDNLLQFRDKFILFHEKVNIYKAAAETLYQMPNYTLQTKIEKILNSTYKTTTSANNMDVSTNKIDYEGILFFLRKRLSKIFTKPSLICLISLLILFKLSMIFGEEIIYKYTLKQVGSDIQKNGVYKGDNPFYMGCIYYLDSFWYFTLIIALITIPIFEYCGYLNFTEDFLHGIRNPGDFIISSLLTCNLPGFIFQILVLMIFEMEYKYFSLPVLLSMILVSLLYFSLANFSLLLFLSFADKVYIPFIIYLMPILFKIFLKDLSLSIITRILGILMFILNPIHILDGLIEVICLRKFINTDKSDGYFDQYLTLKSYNLIKLFRYYELEDNNFTAQKLLKYEKFNPDDLFLIYNLPNNLYFNLCFFALSILSVWLVIIIFGKKKLVQNIRLELIGN